MPATVADGVPGLEARWEWRKAQPGPAEDWGTSIILNQQGVVPRIKLDRIAGLYSLPDVDDSRANRTGAIGEVGYPVVPRGKTLVFEGRVMARSLADLRLKTQAFRTAFSERDALGVWVAIVDTDYAPEMIQHAAYVRVMQLDMDEEVTRAMTSPTPFQLGFTLGTRMLDPRFYAGFDAPIQIVCPTTGAATVVANGGGAPADPKFVVEGVTAGEDVTLAITAPFNANLIFEDLPAGQLIVDFAARTATVAGADVSAKLDPDNMTWWDYGQEGIPAGGATVGVAGGVSAYVWYYQRNW